MTEPDVTLTDYGLGILCSYFVWSLIKTGNGMHRLKWLWTTFFASIVVASLTGGTVHGFFLDEATLGYRILWPTTLLAIGFTSATAWLIIGKIVSDERNFRKWELFSGLLFLFYASVVIFYSQSFKVVILNYLPPIILLLVATVRRYLKTRLKHFLTIALGILVSLTAAFFQQARISVHENYFNHNATYHLIQAIGLWALFVGSKKMIAYGGEYR